MNGASVGPRIAALVIGIAVGVAVVRMPAGAGGPDGVEESVEPIPAAAVLTADAVVLEDQPATLTPVGSSTTTSSDVPETTALLPAPQEEQSSVVGTLTGASPAFVPTEAQLRSAREALLGSGLYEARGDRIVLTEVGRPSARALALAQAAFDAGLVDVAERVFDPYLTRVVAGGDQFVNLLTGEVRGSSLAIHLTIGTDRKVSPRRLAALRDASRFSMDLAASRLARAVTGQSDFRWYVDFYLGMGLSKEEAAEQAFRGAGAWEIFKSVAGLEDAVRRSVVRLVVERGGPTLSPTQP